MTNSQQIKKIYTTKILGVRNYEAHKKEFSVDDFLDYKTLVEFLWEVDTGESDITPAGKSFIEQYFGTDNLAKELSDKGYDLPPDNIETNQQTIAEWLKSLQTMQTATFIQEATGNIQKGAKLKEDLLPPKL